MRCGRSIYRPRSPARPVDEAMSVVWRRRRSCWWLIVLVMTVGDWSAATAEEPERYSPQYLAYPDAPDVDPDTMPPRELAYSAADAPAWVPRVLDRLKANRPSYRLRRWLLLKRDGEPKFLALVWCQWRSSYRRDNFVLYEVNVISEANVQLTYRRSLEDGYVSIVEPSGHDIDGDYIPLLVLAYGSGGAGFFGYGMEVFRLARHSVRVVPTLDGAISSMAVVHAAHGSRLSTSSARSAIGRPAAPIRRTTRSGSRTTGPLWRSGATAEV